MQILNKLTIRNLQLNKKRTIVTIIGILLSVSLITAVSTMFFSARRSLIEFEKREKGNYHYVFYNVQKDDLDIFLNNRKIEENYFVESLGYSKLENCKNEYKPYANVKAFTKEGLKNLGVNLIEGRLPENSSEIVIPSHLKTNGRIEIKTGEKIVLELGERVSNGNKIVGNASLQEAGEELIHTKKHEFTVVGMIERPAKGIEGHSAAGYTFVTCKEREQMEHAMDVYSKYTKKGLRSQYAVTAGILQVDADAFQRFQESEQLSEKEAQELSKKLENPVYEYDRNHYLIDLTNGFGKNSQLNALASVILIVIFIIIGTSIYCIKNSFDISISEKIRQYGMLSSVGATKKQIKKNVFFEARVLGCIGIPLGILAGLFASYVLIHVCNYLVRDMLQFALILDISWLSLLGSVILGSITILLSARKSAVSASKISPIQAIRGSEEIKISGKKIKAPRWVKRIFGIGGEISYKNLMRSRKKYRTTVVSIVMSVSVFIALYSFVDMAFAYIQTEFKKSDYNLAVVYETGKYEDEKLEDIKNLKGIQSYSQEMLSMIEVEHPKYSKEFLKDMEDIVNDSEKRGMSVNVLDETSFRAYVKKLNLDYDEVCDKGILYNTYYSYRIDPDTGKGKVYEIDNYDYKKGDVISGIIPRINEDGTVSEHEENIQIELALVTKKQPMGQSSNELILGPKFYEKLKEKSHMSQIFIETKDATKTQDQIEKILEDKSGELYISNVEENAKMMTSFYTLLSIFLYGFITVISLIGVTNIFNTITTNMGLRQREFAMLKSVGMTKKEFNRMIRLESFFYGMKSLAIGVPLGTILSYLLQKSMNGQGTVLKYMFPLEAILISMAAVFILIACIMRYSVHKIQKQNIIETIRKENI